MSPLILEERLGAVAILTLNRPERHNSLVPELLQALLEAMLRTQVQADLRAMVLQANGRSFSTGGDALGFVENFDDIERYSRRIVGLLNQVMLAMLELPVPVITAVHGIVTGGSIGLVLASDIVLVAPEASFTPYYSEVGPSPDGGWTVLLPRIIGSKRAAEVLILNRTIPAEQSVSWGLASRIVPAGHLRDEALATAQMVAEKKPGSIRHTKRLLNLDRLEVAALLQAELDHFVQQMGTDEAQAGFRDYLARSRADRQRREAGG